MDKTEGMITENYGDYKVEKMLFTYNENEMQENRFNKFVVEQERKGWSYFVIEQQQLALGFSEAEAIMFNFIDGYTKSGKYFWYSTQDICEKTYWGKDKVIGTIKSLVKKGYVIREKGKDRFGNERRFLSTTTKYSLELLKLRGVSENQIGGIGKSDRGVSEKPTHSIIYSNINSNNIVENQKQEQPQEINNSIPKQDSIKPNLTNGDLTYTIDDIWNAYPSIPKRKGTKQNAEKSLEKKTDEEKKAMIFDMKILKLEYRYKIEDITRGLTCSHWIDNYTIQDENEIDNRLRKIVAYHMNNTDDKEKMKKRYKDICEVFGEDKVKTFVKEYGRAKNKITLNIN